MIILKKANAPRYVRPEGITSYLLTSMLTGSEHFTTTLVEISAGGMQRIHNHLPEQIYYILEGSGLMTVSELHALLSEEGEVAGVMSEGIAGNEHPTRTATQGSKTCPVLGSSIPTRVLTMLVGVKYSPPRFPSASAKAPMKYS